jgi:hypothetical protein
MILGLPTNRSVPLKFFNNLIIDKRRVVALYSVPDINKNYPSKSHYLIFYFGEIFDYLSAAICLSNSSSCVSRLVSFDLYSSSGMYPRI